VDGARQDCAFFNSDEEPRIGQCFWWLRDKHGQKQALPKRSPTVLPVDLPWFSSEEAPGTGACGAVTSESVNTKGLSGVMVRLVRSLSGVMVGLVRSLSGNRP
jgi:hypothetical protein